MTFAPTFSPEDFRAYSGLGAGDPTFKGFYSLPSYNAQSASNRAAGQARAAVNRQVRINNLENKFVANSFVTESLAIPNNAINAAMNTLGDYLSSLNILTSYSRDGFMAYRVTNKNDELTWSANLTRLRRALMKGPPDDKGPRINGLPTPSLESFQIATNRVWGVCISWHRLLNSTKGYSDTYANRGLETNYNRLLNQKSKNLTRKAYTLARDDPDLTQYMAKTSASLARAQARAENRIAMLKNIVGGSRDYIRNNNINMNQMTAFRDMDQAVNIEGVDRDFERPRSVSNNQGRRRRGREVSRDLEKGNRLTNNG